MDKRIITPDMIREYKKWLIEEEKSPATIEKYMRDVTVFMTKMANVEICKTAVIAYKEKLLDQYAVRSVNSIIASLNSFFDFAGWGDCRIKAIKLQQEIYRSEDKELTKAEFDRLVETAKQRGDEKLALILQTICGTGIRVSELKFITVDAVRNGEATVNCKGKTRKVFIVSALRKRLKQYIRKNDIADGAIFLGTNGKPINRTTVWREMKSLCKAANVKQSKVYPHNLRKLFARVFYKIEKDIAKLADILGHSSINTTRIYIISTGDEHKRRMEKMKLIV